MPHLIFGRRRELTSGPKAPCPPALRPTSLAQAQARLGFHPCPHFSHASLDLFRHHGLPRCKRLRAGPASAPRLPEAACHKLSPKRSQRHVTDAPGSHGLARRRLSRRPWERKDGRFSFAPAAISESRRTYRARNRQTRVGLWTAKTSPLTHQKTATADSNLECLRVAFEQSYVFESDISDAHKTKR